MTKPDQIPAETYARVFENHAEGAQILEELTARFCRPAKVSGGIDAILQTYHRDGARSVIEFIVARINQANGVQTYDHEG